MALTKYKLGDLIHESFARNTYLTYGIESVRGISNSKEIMTTKADVDESVLHKFYVVYPGEFIYNPRTTRMGDKVGLAYNNTKEPLLFSFNNIAFAIKESANEILLGEYLYLYFNRSEFDRYAITNSWGSATELFTFEEMCDIDIELPDLPTQQKYVDIYKAMVANQQSYERGLEDLKLVCDGYIENAKKQYPNVSISDVSWLSDQRNDGEKCKNVKGLTVYKTFIDTKANMDGVSLNKYKLVEAGDIAYVPTTNRNGDRIACGLSEESCIISSIYEVLKVNKEKCYSEYLFLWFTRSEMDRFARYNSWGSAREVIEWNDLGSYRIPLPPIPVQRAIVDIYKEYTNRKRLNTQLKAQIKDICPILIRGSLEEGKV